MHTESMPCELETRLEVSSLGSKKQTTLLGPPIYVRLRNSEHARALTETSYITIRKS